MKNLFVMLLLFVSVPCIYASNTGTDDLSDENGKPDKVVRKKFFNFSYLSDKIRLSDGNFDLRDLGGVFDEAGDIVNDNVAGVRNNYGFSLTRGRTFMFHNKPIARLVSIGLDAVFFDVSYSNYTVVPASLGVTVPGENESISTILEERTLNKMEYSLQVGPSVTITPGQKLTIEAYFRYAPTFSVLLSNPDGFSAMGNYATMFVTGGMVSWGIIGVGAEYRFGDCSYNNFTGALQDFSAKTSGFRAYITLRFK